MNKENLIEDYEYDEELFGDLNNSVPLHLYLFTDNAQLKDAFNNVLHKCFARKDLDTTKRLNDRRKHIRKIVLSLYKEYEDDKTKYITISLNNNDWAKKGRYGKLGMSLTFIKDVLAKLEQKKFITLWKGKKHHNPEKRKQTRIRATEKLIDFMHSNKAKAKQKTPSQTIKELIQADQDRYLSEPDRPRIILKDKDKNEMKIARKTDAVIESEEILKDYEDLLIHTKIYNPKTERLLTPYEKFQKRVFSRGRLDYNGRIHGGFWQNVNKDKYRKGITIDGHKTFEIDIKGTFPVLVYHLLGLDFWGQYDGIKQEDMHKADPYYLEGYTDRKDHGEAFRNALKLVFNASINKDATGIHGVSLALKYKMKDEWLPKEKITESAMEEINKVRPKMIRQFLYNKHKPLEDHFFDERLGMVVMNQESRIVLRVLRECVNKKEPVLSIFDSFIAKDTKENRLWLSETITNCYAQEFGYRFTGFQTVK
jgi:hypothetical protein